MNQVTGPEIQNAKAAIVNYAQGTNQSGVRAYNERLVLTLVRQLGPLAKAQIARLTGLSAQAVSIIMRELEADGLLEKGQPIRGKKGQPSVPMGLARDGAYFIGLNVGRRSLDMILINFLGDIEGRVQITHRCPTPGHVVRFANDSIGQLLDQLRLEERRRVAGLGIALPFRLWEWAKDLGVEPEKMASWRTCDIASEIGGNWSFPVYLRNDASAACGAELVFGKRHKPADFLYFFIGHFIGGGLVIGNQLYTGQSGNAAAVGSMPVGFADGQMRQLVDVASLAELERMLRVQDADVPSALANPAHWPIDDQVLADWIERASEGIAFAIGSSACVIDVECVLIDGWMPVSVRAEIVRQTSQRLAEMDIAGIEKPQVSEGSIGSNARSLGAASLPLSERFLLDRSAY